jgi:hypothetical protein
MARATDPRFDFTGGLNLAFSEEVKDRTEVRYAQNLRHDPIGSISTRLGTRRIHDTAIGSGDPVLGLSYWAAPGGAQIVAIAGGKLYYKTLAATDFTEGGTGLSTTARPRFAKHAVSSVANLFLTDGTYRRWTGSALSTPGGGAPSSALYLRPYKTRMFVCGNSPTLYYSEINNPLNFVAPLGGSGLIQTYDTENLVGLGAVGDSLLPYKQDSIARFTGVSSQNIRIDQETAGVSDRIGLRAPGALAKLNRREFFLTSEGFYVTSNAEPQEVGLNVNPAILAWNDDHVGNAVVAPHRGRREVWCFGPSADSEENDEGYIYNDRLDSWTGPWGFEGFNVCSACPFKREDGTWSILLGGYDGFVREADVEEVGCTDDSDRDSTAGTPFEWKVTWPELLFNNPTRLKDMTPDTEFHLDLEYGGHANAIMSSEEMGEVACRIIGRGAGVRPYAVSTGVQGTRISVSLEGTGAVQINGIIPAAMLGRSGR